MDVSLAEAFPKILQYAGVLLSLGSAAAPWLIRPSPVLAPDAVPSRRARLVRLARVAAVVVLVAVCARLVGHTLVAFGDEPLSLDNLRLIAVESRWGSGWRSQGLAALILVLATVPLSSVSRVAWAPFQIAAVVQTFALPMLGHAAGEPSRVALHGAHALAAGLWLGTLATCVMLGVGRDAANAACDRAIVGRFSPLALTAAAGVAATGTVAAWTYVGSVSALVASAYGRTLLAKVVLVVAVGACGTVNWRRTRAGLPPDRRWLVIETLLAALVVIASGVLTETAHP